MDEATQQNSALVEENAATSKTLEAQAAAMNDRVAAFRVRDAAPGSDVRAASAPARAAPPARETVSVMKHPAAVRRAAPSRAYGGAATAAKLDPDSMEF